MVQLFSAVRAPLIQIPWYSPLKIINRINNQLLIVNRNAIKGTVSEADFIASI